MSVCAWAFNRKCRLLDASRNRTGQWDFHHDLGALDTELNRYNWMDNSMYIGDPSDHWQGMVLVVHACWLPVCNTM